jgi:hypothetical protein
VTSTVSCPNWGLGPCGYNDTPCGKCVHLPAVKARPVLVERPTCPCGNPLLLIRPGRNTCERCRLATQEKTA